MAVGNRFNGTGNGRLLLKEKPFGECTHQLSLPATSDFCPNHAPVAADSAAGREGVRSTTMGESRKRTEESLLSSGRFRLSPATGTHSPAQPSSLIQSTFTSHTGSLFLSLYAPRYCLAASAGFGRQFAKLRALSRLRRRYDSRKKRNPFVPLRPLVPAPLAAHPGQLHVQARKDALFQPGDVALRNPQCVGNLLLRHLPRAAQTKAKLHDLLLAQGQARQRRAQ